MSLGVKQALAEYQLHKEVSRLQSRRAEYQLQWRSQGIRVDIN